MSETHYNECADAIVFGSPVVDEIDENGGVQINFVPVYQENGNEVRCRMSLNVEKEMFDTFAISLFGTTSEESKTIAAFLDDVSSRNEITRMVFLEGAKGEGPVVDGRGPANCVTCIVFLKGAPPSLNDYFASSDVAELVVEGRADWQDYEIIEGVNSFIKSPKFSANKRLWEVVFTASPNKE